MTRPVIACDVDGVLADLASKVCERLNGRRSATSIRNPEQFVHYNFHANLTADEGAYVSEIAREPGLCKSLAWYAGARTFLAQLHKLGDVFAVTAPWHAPAWDSERRDWLADEMPRAHVVSVSALAKPWACASADVLIEDNAEIVDSWIHMTTTGIAVLLDRPWNRHFTTTNRNVHRATSYAHALAIITEHL